MPLEQNSFWIGTEEAITSLFDPMLSKGFPGPVRFLALSPSLDSDCDVKGILKFRVDLD